MSVYSGDLIADFKVVLDGTQIAPEWLLVEIRVENTAGVPDVCVLRFADGDMGSLEDPWPVSNDAAVKLGADLVVSLGSVAGGELSAVFHGEVTAIEARSGLDRIGGSGSELVLTAYDKSHKLHSTSATRTLRQVTVSDVVRKVAGEAGLSVGTLAGATGHGVMETVTQVDESNWAFLSRLARSVGTVLDASVSKLDVVDPTATSAPVATVTWGQDLISFRMRASTLAQVAEVDVRGWDPKAKAAITGTATPKASSSVGDDEVAAQVAGTKALVATGDLATSADASATAGAIAARLGHERVQGEATFWGTPRVQPGTYVDFKAVGERFAGAHRVVSAVHRLQDGTYYTDVVLGAGQSLGEDVAATGPKNGFTGGLVVGIVTSNDDPESQGRVKVKFPTLDDSTESGWARVARESAGDGRGLISTLEVNDEVVVGFEHGSPGRPVVLGAMFNGKDLPGAVLPEKAGSVSARFPRDIDTLTKGKGVLEFEKGLTVGAKAGPMDVSSDGAMTLKVAKPNALTLETPGQLKLSGKQGAELSASGPLKVTATGPVTLESNAMVQIKGTMVEVNATGIVKVSGATVMLG